MIVKTLIPAAFSVFVISSSPFASQATSSSLDVDEESHTVEPYLYKPTDDEESSDEAGKSSDVYIHVLK